MVQNRPNMNKLHFCGNYHFVHYLVYKNQFMNNSSYEHGEWGVVMVSQHPHPPCMHGGPSWTTLELLFSSIKAGQSLQVHTHKFSAFNAQNLAIPLTNRVFHSHPLHCIVSFSVLFRKMEITSSIQINSITIS